MRSSPPPSPSLPPFLPPRRSPARHPRPLQVFQSGHRRSSPSSTHLSQHLSSKPPNRSRLVKKGLPLHSPWRPPPSAEFLEESPFSKETTTTTSPPSPNRALVLPPLPLPLPSPASNPPSAPSSTPTGSPSSSSPPPPSRASTPSNPSSPLPSRSSPPPAAPTSSSASSIPTSPTLTDLPNAPHLLSSLAPSLFPAHSAAWDPSSAGHCFPDVFPCHCLPQI